MNYLILISHGELSQGVHSALKMMCGEHPEVLSTSLLDGEDVPVFKSKFEKLLEPINFDTDNLVLCADIQGGSPFTTAVDVLNNLNALDKCVIFAGLNLPMAVTACIMKDNLSKEMLVTTVLDEAKTAVSHFTVEEEVEEEEDF